MISMARTKGTMPTPATALDLSLLLAVACLIGFGVVMVTSASLHLGGRYGAPFVYLNRHLIALAIGLLCALIAVGIPMKWWEKSSGLLYVVGLLSLMLVMVPGLGKTVNGATRWVAMGPFNLQTSEYMKLIMLMYMAGYLVRRQTEVAHTLLGVIKPVILLVLATALLIWQPDFGGAMVLLITAFGLLFLGGAPLWQFALLFASASMAAIALVLVSPYRMARVTSFLDPWADPLASGYQLSQALIAFGRGEWLGVGLGNGIQKQFYLPEAHTDFLMAVVGEEFGLLGTLALILLFVFIVWRAFDIGAKAERAEKRFSAYVAYGIGIWIGTQAFINIGVNVGLLPTKGLTLPFMSYGSNSMIVGCIAIAVLLRIHRETIRCGEQGGVNP